MEPPALATDLRKLLLWLTLVCVSCRVVEDRSIGVVVSLKTIEMGGVRSKMGVVPEILRALRAQPYNRNPLQEILDPPLIIRLNTIIILTARSSTS